MPRFTHALHAITFGLLVIGTACGGGGDGGTAPAPSITLAVSPSALTVQQGTSGTVTVSLTRANFTAAVGVSVEGLPSGISVAASPASLTSSIASTTINVSVASSVATGTYTATVRGTATGVGSATATYDIVVVAPPDFSIAATPTAVTVSSAATATANIAITRTGGFAGTVDLTLQSAQSGITGAFTPASASAGTSSLVISATSAVPLGTYPVTVSGNGTGIGVRTSTINVTVVAPPDFSLSATPTAITLTAGTTGSSAITITRSGGFTADVALSLSSAQSGITGSFAPPSASGTTSTVTISVASTVAAGTYAATVTGVGAGPGTRTATINVTVTRVAITATPSTLALVSGTSGTAAIAITRGTFGGAIALASGGQPTGMTVTFDPTPTSGTTSTATVSVGAAVTPGSYPLTITASGTGIASASATLTVTVSAPTFNTEFHYCPSLYGGVAPAFVAYQDGAGPWTAVVGTAVGNEIVYKFNLNASYGGVVGILPMQPAAIQQTNGTSARARALRSLTNAAFPSRDGGTFRPQFLQPAALEYHSFVRYATRDELIAYGRSIGCPVPSGRTAQAILFSVPPGQYVNGSMGGATASVFGSQSFTLTDVPLGPQTFIAGRSNLVNTVQWYDRYVLLRDQNQPSGSMLFADFLGANSVAAASSSFTLQNTLGDNVGTRSIFHYQPGSVPFASEESGYTTTATREYRTVPAPSRRSGEFDEIQAIADATVSQFGDIRTVRVVETTPAQAFTLTFGARPPVTTLSVFATAPYARPRLQVTLPAEYSGDAVVELSSVNNFSTFGNHLQFGVTPAYRAAVGWGQSLDLIAPDFSALPGFQTQFAVARGRSMIATTFSSGPLTATPGRVYKASQRFQDVIY
jgi:hypothetical protein